MATIKGENCNKTRTSQEKLVSAATQLFADKWYGAVSVAEICRKAGLSNGCFYRYYKTKEELFKFLLSDITEKIDRALARVSGDTRLERLSSFSEIVFNFSRDNVALIHVFREGQYRFFENEKQLGSVYITSLSKVLDGPVSESEYEFALGGLRFAAIRAAFYKVPNRLDALKDILGNGLFTVKDLDEEKIFNEQNLHQSKSPDPCARNRLLLEGKKLFGKLGYFETNIHQVTDAAGLSVGAFYTHFESKETFYAEIIRQAGSDLRHFISTNMGEGLNRCERELRGLWLFTNYLYTDSYCYNIVREAEFVLPDAVSAYYDAFVKGYRKSPEGSGGLDEGTSIEYLLGVAHYFGLEVVFDPSAIDAKTRIKEIGRLLRYGLRDRLER
ncbi:MAG: TetR/AcrR family transcriptional regulator [Spirochaetes bacterium]|nr:TetR/AcrR family transcriptional regulator [Spirochaetota bacterium]